MPLKEFCCHQPSCKACAPAELLAHGKFKERMAWLRHHYQAKHPAEFTSMQKKSQKTKQKSRPSHSSKNPRPAYRSSGRTTSRIGFPLIH